jgi:hypothetical protein
VVPDLVPDVVPKGTRDLRYGSLLPGREQVSQWELDNYLAKY